MDIFDEQILAMLSDGKPKVLAQLLDEVDFSRNTLKLHLKRLISQRLSGKRENAIKRKRKAKICLFYSVEITAASFRRTLRPVHHGCIVGVQPLEAHLQVREGRILQEHAEKMRSPKLSPNHKRRINTILNHFSNKLAHLMMLRSNMQTERLERTKSLERVRLAHEARILK